MTDSCFTAKLMPFEQAKQKLLNAISAISDTETVNVTSTDKRVIAEDIQSPINVPAYNNSAMDGYAIRDDQLNNGKHSKNQFLLAGTAYAGSPYLNNLADGECIRIMTGAVLPPSATAVVMQENVEQIHNTVGSLINLTKPAQSGDNIRLAGEDIKKGQVIFTAGDLIKAVDVGLLSSLGLQTVRVFKKLTVAVFSTGDELKLPGQILTEGDIYESNSQVLTAMLQRMNIDVIPMGIIPDDKDAIAKAFIHANNIADAVISSGGVSVGDADYTKEVLDELGHIDFWKVAMKPGKPFAFGRLSKSVFFGLPGNPVSATVTFHQLVKPALQIMSGMKATNKQLLTAKSTQAIRKKPGRMDFQRGTTSVDENGLLLVTPLSNQGSGILSSISRANCYIVLSQECNGIKIGEQVNIELFDDIVG